MYKNYIFDLYGTLVDINTNEEKAYLWERMAEFYGYYGAMYKPNELKKAYKKACKDEKEKNAQFDCPEIKVEYVFLRLFKDKGIDADINLAIHAGQMFRIISTKYIKLYDGVIELFEELKKRGKRIYLLSNAQKIFTEYEIKLLGIYDYFDGIVLSSEESCCKPDKNYYEIVLNRYNLKKEESIMIGNDEIADIKGSYEAGLDSLYIHANISPEIKGELLSKYTIMDGDFTKVKDLVLSKEAKNE